MSWDAGAVHGAAWRVLKGAAPAPGARSLHPSCSPVTCMLPTACGVAWGGVIRLAVVGCVVMEPVGRGSARLAIPGNIC